MSGLTGSSKKIGIGITDEWSDARELGANSGIDSINSFEINAANDVLESSPIGAGNDMLQESELGATNPTVTLDCQPKFDGAFPKLASLLFGHSAVPMNMGSGAYCHSIIYNATKPTSYAVVVEQKTTDEVFEVPSALPTSLNLSAGAFPSYLACSVELLGDQVNPGDSVINDFSTSENITVPSSKIITAKTSDKYLFNAQAGGALSDSDKVNITSFDITFERPLEHVQEMKNATGNGIPRVSGNYAFIPMLTVTTRDVADLTYFEAWRDGTEYKAEFNLTGSLIGGSNYYNLRIFFPRLKIVEWPSNPTGNAGENPQTIVFKCLEAASSPTGMLDTAPYMLLTNSTSTNPLATLS